MYYKIMIVDGNAWMYLDMAYQMVTMLENNGFKAEVVSYDHTALNTNQQTCVFLGTRYRDITIPSGSIVSNFDNDTLLFDIIPEYVFRTCTIWDYSAENIDFIHRRYPETRCFLFQMGYTQLLRLVDGYDEDKKDIDVLLIGAETDRRNKIMNQLSDLGVQVLTVYRKIGTERAELIERSKITISVYGSEHRHCISASRFVPILSNNGFIIAEKCSNKQQESYWSDFMITTKYDDLVSMVLYYLERPELRFDRANHFCSLFRRTSPSILLKDKNMDSINV
jgi:hypothetical protein